MRDGKKFRAQWELGGESLKRPPRGFDAGHELIEDLKRTDHIAISTLEHTELTRPDLVRRVADRIARTREYLGFLAQALGLPF